MNSIRKYYLIIAALIMILEITLHDAQTFFGLQHASENSGLDFTGLATRYGHRPIRYEVTTEDGYILTLFRLPGASKYPVLLMHGILDTSDTWLIRGENSLGVTLANNGYDLWFPNSRGNRYSQGHTSLDSNKDTSYWNWSFHELGYYDLPAVIDRILNETRSPSLTAIGHSRGNEIFYILGSTRPEYNSKINLMIALAPICYFHNVKAPVTTLFKMLPILEEVFDKFHTVPTQVLGYNGVDTQMLRTFCTLPLVGNEKCLKFVISPFLGDDQMEVGPPFVNVFIYHFPAGTSWKDMLHFAQLGNRGQFAQYDYGTDKNLQVYNSTVPPLYNLTQVTMPIALLAGRNDPLSTVPDVTLLREQLANVVDFTVNRRALLSHLDHTWGKNARVYLFPDIYRVLTRYNKV